LRLRNVTFATWLRSHDKKAPEERWLRELYPWPVLAQVDCDEAQVGRPQRIAYDGVEYDVTLKSIRWQPKHGTYRYRLLVESDGLGWHARSFSDEIMSNNIKKISGIRVKNGLGMTKIKLL
jgi:hypothetical protein